MKKILLMLMTLLILTGCVLSNAWSRGQLDLVKSYTGREPNPTWPYLDAVDVTTEMCGPVTNCVQAVRSDYVTLLKFASVQDARIYTEMLGGTGHQIDPLVLHFDGKPVTEAERSDIIHGMSNVNADSPD